MEYDNKRIHIGLNTEDIISQITRSNDDTVNCLRNYHNEIILLGKQLEETKQDLAKKREECIRLDTSYHEELYKSDKYEKKCEQLSSEKGRLEEQLNSEKNIFKTKETDLNNRLSGLTRQITEKDSSIEEYRATIAEQNSRIKALSDSANNFKYSAEENLKNYESSQEKLKGLISQKEILENQLTTSHQDNKQLSDEKTAISIQKSDLELKLHQTNEVLNRYRSLEMDKLDKAYTLFRHFKDRTRNNLKAVFETDTFLGFVSNSMQWGRIEGIWEQTRRKIVNDDQEDLQELHNLFLLLFETYNAGYTEAPYELINPEIGSKYNSDEQVIKNQKSDGTITKVLLEGYITKKTSAIHKAMILVE